MPIAITPKLLTAYNKGGFPHSFLGIHVLTNVSAAEKLGIIDDLRRTNDQADSLLNTLDWHTEVLVIYSRMENIGGGMELQAATFDAPNHLTLMFRILDKPPGTPSFGTEFMINRIYRLALPSTPNKFTVQVNGQTTASPVTLN